MTAAPLYGEPLRSPVRNGLGTAALVLGLVSLPFGFLLVLPILAIVFGIIGRRRASRGEATNGGLALAGIIVGAVGLVIGACVITGFVWLASSPSWDHYRTCDRAAVTPEQKNACAQQLSRDLFGTP